MKKIDGMSPKKTLEQDVFALTKHRDTEESRNIGMHWYDRGCQVKVEGKRREQLVLSQVNATTGAVGEVVMGGKRL